MTEPHELYLSVEDAPDGQPVSLASIPLGLLTKFNEQAASFLKGSHKDFDVARLRVGIENGSYRLVLAAVAAVPGLVSDLAMLSSGNLDDIDPKRAEVVEEWQSAAYKNPGRRYLLADEAQVMVAVHAGSAFQRQVDGVWLAVEKYLHGQVSDLGGTQSNLHLRLADGRLQKIATSVDQVLKLEQNLVYRTALLRVRAEEELSTGKLRNVRLLDFVDYRPQFDAEAFAAMTEKGRRAWADVPDATQWVEDLRGAA